MEFNNKKMTTITLVVIFFAAVDRLCKSLALNNFFNTPIDLIGDLVRLNFVKNYYIAFSIPIAGWWLNAIIILIIFALIYYLIYTYSAKRDFTQATIFLFIIFGAISNLVDRLKFGYIIDYIDVKYYTVFNIADMMIVGGVIGLVVVLVFNKKRRSEIGPSL